MSNTKGSMLISNANAVGTELVNQLGGTGYTPAKWADAINLLGISDDDKASALAGITEGTYTGSERGAIKYSNCNAVGAMLNKKFSTNRGFKPVEWESAISKLTPLAEGTVSGAICNIVNGADGVPLKNWIVTLPASLDGYTEVNGVRSGKNLVNGINGYTVLANATEQMLIGSCEMVANVAYTLSCLMTGTPTARTRNRWAVAKSSNMWDGTAVFGNDFYTSPTQTFTPSESGIYYFFIWSQGIDVDVSYNNFMLEVGSTATAYEAYETPTTYTAQLGRTIYGGTADVVTGEGEDENGNAYNFTPITPTPETLLGVSNWWSDNGDSTITYRKDPDIPDPPVQLLNMNNNNEDNNEGV